MFVPLELTYDDRMIASTCRQTSGACHALRENSGDEALMLLPATEVRASRGSLPAECRSHIKDIDRPRKPRSQRLAAQVSMAICFSPLAATKPHE